MSLYCEKHWVGAVALCCSVALLGSCQTHEFTRREPQSTINEIEPSSSDEFSTHGGESVGPLPKQDAQFDWPVDRAKFVRGFSKLPTGRRHKPHLGLDLAAQRGTPIFASHSGVVIYAGRQFKGYGQMIMIKGEGGFATLYAHLSKIKAREGQNIRQGDVVGLMGKTGRARGVHLHFEIRTPQGPVDPLLYLPQVRVATGAVRDLRKEGTPILDEMEQEPTNLSVSGPYDSDLGTSASIQEKSL